jgi:hypothetical protein
MTLESRPFRYCRPKSTRVGQAGPKESASVPSIRQTVVYGMGQNERLGASNCGDLQARVGRGISV